MIFSCFLIFFNIFSPSTFKLSYYYLDFCSTLDYSAKIFKVSATCFFLNPLARWPISLRINF